MTKLYSNYFFLNEGENIWFISNFFSILCCYSTEKKQIITSKSLKNNNKNELAYSGIAKINNKIYVFPANSSQIAIFDLDKNIIKYIDVIEEVTMVNKYMSCVTCYDKVYAFPGNARDIIEINENDEVKRYPFELKEEIFKINKFQNCVRKRKNNIYLLSSFSNELYVWNIDNKELKTVTIGNHEDRFSVFDFIDEGNIIFGKENGDILIYDSNTFETNYLENNIPDFVSHRYDINRATFSDILVCGEQVFLFPAQANMILKVNINKKEIEKVIFDFDDSDIKGELTSLVYKSLNNKVVFFRLDSLNFCELDLNDLSIIEHEVYLYNSSEDTSGIFKDIINNNCVLKEGEIIGINEYIGAIS